MCMYFSSISSQEFSGSSPKRRRAEEKDEGIGSPDTLEEEKMEELKREMLELRQQLDKERSARMQMEEQVRQQEELWLKRLFVGMLSPLPYVLVRTDIKCS